MDFYSLSRKQLQALSKRNKIPANITNVAMADALTALHQVEGLDEILNPVEADAQQLQEEMVDGTQAIHRTACRTSTPRKDVDVQVTPAMPSSRRQAPAISTRRKKEAQMPEDEKKGEKGKPTLVPTTPAAPTTGTRAYNTRRSVRLLEKNLSKMSLMNAEDIGLMKIDDISEYISNVSQQMEDSSAETEERPILHTVSTVVSQKTDELEVTSQEKNTECELGSWSELQDSNLKLEGSSETCNDSNKVWDGSDFGLNGNKPMGKAVHSDNEAETGLLFELEESCLGTKEDASLKASEDASMEVTNQDVAAFSLSVEIPDDATMEVKGQDIVGSLPMSSISKIDNKGGDDSADISALSDEVSEDASMEVADQDVAALTVEVPDDASIEATDQYIDGLCSMSSVCNDSVSLKELVACNTDNQDGNDSMKITDASMSLQNGNTNTLVDTVVIPEEVAISELENNFSDDTAKHKNSASTEVPVGNIDEVRLYTMTVAPIQEQKTSDIPIKSIGADQSKGEFHCPAPSGSKDVADECIQEDDKNKIYIMKENTGIYEQMSMRELKKMLKNLTLDSKSNSMSTNVAKEVDKKRTALQVLPENQMTAGATTNDS